jgi:hypothetical protein
MDVLPTLTIDMSTSLFSKQGVESEPSKSDSFSKQDVEPKSSTSDLDGIVELLELSDLQKHFLRSRLLEQVKWMEGKASHAKNRYTLLRLTSIIGGVLVPILISLNFNNNQRANDIVRGLSITLGGVVAISSAVEEFFHYGERWRHYRRTAESLKIQSWQFSQLSEPYQTYESHKQAFPAFVGQVESILQRDVEVYMTQIQQEKKANNEESSEQNGDDTDKNSASQSDGKQSA